MNRWSVFCVAVLLYLVSIFGTFVQDDLVVISGDSGMGKIESLVLTWSRPYYYMTGTERTLYRPMTSFTFYVNSLVTGLSPWGFRLVNVILYGVVCGLVYEFLKKLIAGFAGVDANKYAFWGAVVFAVLPVHTEVVNNVVGRGEMLALSFVLLAIMMNLKRRWDLSALFLFSGLLSKESAVVGVVILLYLIWRKSKKETREDLLAAVIFVLMAVACFVCLRTVALGGVALGNNATIVENPLKFVSVSQRVMTGISLIPFGVGKIIFPINLSYDYSFNQLKTVNNWYDFRVVLGILMIFGSGLIVFRSSRRLSFVKDVLILGMMFYWIPILITGNILFPIGTIFGERLLFMPTLGIVMIGMSAVLGAKHFERWNKFAMRFFVAVILLYMCRSVVRNFDWLNQKKLFIHDASYVENSVISRSNEAAMYMIEGDYEKGVKVLKQADAIYDKYPELLNNWGVYFMKNGEYERARQKFEECLTTRPGYYLCENNLDDLSENGE